MTKRQQGFLLLAFVLLAILYFLRPYGLNLNAAMYLQAAQLLLQGQKPYIDFIDLNPPLIFYINVVPAFINQFIGTSAQIILIFKVLLLLAIFASTWSVYMILKEAKPSIRSLTFPITLSFLLFCMFLIHNRVYGDREHLFVIALLPYIFLRFMRYSEKPRYPLFWSALIGLFLGITACLKPHFLFNVVVLELALLWFFHKRKPHFSAEFNAALIFTALYVLHFFLLPQDIQNAFFNEIVPMVLNNYSSYHKSLAEILLMAPPLLFVTLIFCIYPFLIKGASAQHILLRVLALLGISFIANYLLQFKGWNYHLIPLYSFVFIAVAVFIGTLKMETQSRAKRFLFATVGSFAILCAYQTYEAVRIFYEPQRSPYFRTSAAKLYQDVAAHSQYGDPILIISAHNMYSYPLLLQMARTPGSRYLFHFPLSFFALDKNNPFSVLYVQRLKDDIQNRTPKLIVIAEETPEKNFLPQGFKTKEYLAHAGVIDSEFQELYRELSADDSLTIYKRKD